MTTQGGETNGPASPSLREHLHELYFGITSKARTFQFGLLAIDFATIMFFVVSSFVAGGVWFLVFDYVLGALLSVELAARLVATRRPWRQIFHLSTLFDVIVIVSLAAPVLIQNLGFLRVVRMLRLLRTYHLLSRLRTHSKWFRRHEELIHSALNLVVFMFVVAAIVFVVEGHQNPAISNYFDALYFTVTTLTTTGFGDITMTDTAGRILAVLIMVFGVTLFLRLIQVIFRPPKVHVVCQHCGLSRHDPDAVHCKHCGVVMNIPTEGEWV